jgi:hypothetical protein
MQKILNNKKLLVHYSVLTCIVLLSFWFRWSSLDKGLPYFYDEDEAHHFNRTVNMVKTGDYNPHYFLKPTLHFYLRVPVTAAAFLMLVRKGEIRSVKEMVTGDPYGLAGYAFSSSHPDLVLANRLFSLLLSTIALILTISIALTITELPIVAYTTGFFIAINPSLTEYASFIGVDALVGCMVMMTVFFAINALKSQKRTTLFLSAFSAGLACSSKYNALPIVVVPFAVLFCNFINRRQPFPWGDSFILLMFIGSGFLTGTPYAILKLPEFLDGVASEVWHYGIAGHGIHTEKPGLSQCRFYLSWLGSSQDGLGTVRLLIAFVGIPFLVYSFRKFSLVFLIFPISYFLLMSLQKANFVRNMYVLIPFFALLGAYGLFALSHMLFTDERKRGAFFLAAMALSMIFPCFGSLRKIETFETVRETRKEIEQWLKERSANLEETALAGELQFSHTVHSLPAVSRYNSKEQNNFELFQQGFDFSIVPKNEYTLNQDSQDTTNEKISDLIQVQQVLIYEGRRQTLDKTLLRNNGMERVVNNPSIVVNKLISPYFEKVQKDVSPAQIDSDNSAGKIELDLSERLPSKYVLKLKNTEEVKEEVPDGKKISNANVRNRLTFCDYSGTENYCWLNYRITYLQLTEQQKSFLVNSTKNKTIKLSVSLMSPWPHQRVVLGSSCKIETMTPGVWSQYECSLPLFSDAAERRGFSIFIDKIHAPKELAGKYEAAPQDERKLGVAVKDLVLTVE